MHPTQSISDFEFVRSFHNDHERVLERLKKYCSHLEPDLLTFGEALAKEHVWRTPVTEPKRSQKSKDLASFAI
jgi:hypothetical protein